MLILTLSITQVFCCIAIVGVAIIYFIGLWIRQVFTWPRRDKHFDSKLPAPPRACTGNGAWPVYGHTRLFCRLAGDVALLFQPASREWGCFPEKLSRTLGECFAIFIWGQWRIVIKGPERTKLIMESMDLKESWPWTPPVTLLGKSCFSFLEEDELEGFRRLIERPLAHRVILQYAPLFADLAEKCLDEVIAGKFRKKAKKNMPSGAGDGDSMQRSNYTLDFGYTTDCDCEDDTANSAGGELLAKIKWESLRSYTFDIFDGPIMNMNKWTKSSEQSQGEPSKEGERLPHMREEDEEEKDLEPREKMILWMDRMKRGLSVIKITFGPEWMHIWRCSEYGRALHARMHLQDIVQSHVEKVVETVPVKHERGHEFLNPTTQPIPFLSMRDNMRRNKEGILGGPALKPNLAARPRTRSMPVVNQTDSEDETFDSSEYIEAFHIEQDLAKPKYCKTPPRNTASKKVLSPPIQPLESPSHKKFRNEIEKKSAKDDIDLVRKRLEARIPKQTQKEENRPTMSVVERLLRQEDLDGNGLSQVVTTELSLLLWMMMDAGNAWTAMALNLLSTDKEARDLVQEEIDCLELEYGRENLFTRTLLAKMPYLDGLLYEAIRLCPAFLGGMKQTTESVELTDAGVQIPKNSNVIFCQPSDMKFDIHHACGRKPEDMGKRYPTVEL
jgi:cytochrome P450